MSSEFEALTADQAAEKEVDAFQERAGVLLSPATAGTLFHCMKRVFDWGKLAATTAPVAESPTDALNFEYRVTVPEGQQLFLVNPPADAEVAQADLLARLRRYDHSFSAHVDQQGEGWVKIRYSDLAGTIAILAASQRSAAAKEPS